MYFYIQHWMGQDISDLEEIKKYFVVDHYEIPEAEFGNLITTLSQKYDVMITKQRLWLDSNGGRFRQR